MAVEDSGGAVEAWSRRTGPKEVRPLLEEGEVHWDGRKGRRRRRRRRGGGVDGEAEVGGDGVPPVVGGGGQVGGGGGEGDRESRSGWMGRGGERGADERWVGS